MAEAGYKSAGFVAWSESPAGARAANTRRHHVPLGERSPSQWSSEEAYYRQGLFSGITPYAPNEWGGALRQLKWYKQDKVGSKATSTGEEPCNKKLRDSKKLSPGLFVRFTVIGLNDSNTDVPRRVLPCVS